MRAARISGRPQRETIVRKEDMHIADLAAALQAMGSPLLIPFRLAHECGLEDTEIVRLRWEDVHLQSRCVFVAGTSKYKKFATGITASVAESLRTLQTEWQELGPLPVMVCLDEGGKPYSLQTIRAALVRMCERLEIPGIGWNTIHESWLRRQGL